MDRATEVTRARYNRMARVYDVMQWYTERARVKRRRQEFWSHVPTGKVLEVGVGTGKNMPYYPKGARVTAIDLSEAMLVRA